MSDFVDHFATQAAGYAVFRPSYPPALAAFLAGLAPGRDLAWDCGTGNGQAAVQMAEHFARVVATDASPSQLAQARPHPRVEYREAGAERSGLEAASVDLVTVAQALHWFPLDAFYAEVARVLVDGGVLAVWTYGNVRVAPDVDPILEWFHGPRVGRYWPPGREHVEDGYRSLSFPFPELPSGNWAIEADLNRREFLGYVDTWSAVARCRVAEGRDPLAELHAALLPLWPDADRRRRVTWPIALRVGRRQRGRERDRVSERGKA